MVMFIRVINKERNMVIHAMQCSINMSALSQSAAILLLLPVLATANQFNIEGLSNA